MKKTLILRNNGVNNFLIRNIDNYDIDNYYNKNINSIILRVINKLNFFFLYRFVLGNWTKHIKNYNQFIIFDIGYNKQITKFIKKKSKNCKIIFWFWNPVYDDTKICLSDENIDEIWSYDEDDCKKFKLKYNTQFYNKKIKLKNKSINNDILFLGNDKGRKKIIEKYNELFIKNKLKTNIIIIKNKKEYINYNEYLDLISESNCILDIVNGNVCGLTLRCMESLFFEKKLITNNKSIINYDFYNPNNIFVIGIDNMDDIKRFVSSSYYKVDKKIVEQYDFEHWLKRFEEI